MNVVDLFSREGTLLLGGGAAILLQSANPVIGEAVAEHSDFTHRPLDRLNNTLTFVYATMLGSPEEAALVAKYTRRTHGRVPGADDPTLQLWVAATLYAVAVQVHEKVHGPLDPDDAQTVLDAYAALGTALEVPRSAWPASPGLFAAYWQDAVAGLEVVPAAREVARSLFHPVTAPLWMRAALPFIALLTADLLGETLRDGFGMPWSRHRARRAAAAWAVVRVATRVLPARVLATPSRRYLERLREVARRAS